MRTFFYFIPNRQALTPPDAAKLGLAYAFERGIDCAQTERGPEGLKGIVCAQQDSYDDGQLGYHEKQQVWREVPAAPGAESRVFVGYYRDALPGPQDLARKKQLDGWPLELGDDLTWSLPMARSYSERDQGGELDLIWYVNLPQRLELAADGRWCATEILARYAPLWHLHEAWLRWRTGTATDADRALFNDQGQTEGAVLCLQTNYRVGRVEASLLGLLTDEHVPAILDRLIDRPTWDGWAKKKMTQLMKSTAPDGSDSSVGPAAATQTTAPPVPT